MRKRPRLPTAVGSARFAAQIEPRSQRDGGAFLHKSPPQRQGPRASEEHSQHQPASCKRKGHRGPFRKKAALCHCHGCQCHHQLQQLSFCFAPRKEIRREVQSERADGRRSWESSINQSIHQSGGRAKARGGRSEGLKGGARGRLVGGDRDASRWGHSFSRRWRARSSRFGPFRFVSLGFIRVASARRAEEEFLGAQRRHSAGCVLDEIPARGLLAIFCSCCCWGGGYCGSLCDLWLGSLVD